jgi:hypothetical protein
MDGGGSQAGLIVSRLNLTVERRGVRRVAVAITALAVVIIVARWPVTTATGLNYRVTVKRLTLVEKVLAFVDRDLEMRRLSQEIAGSGGAPDERLLRLYAWVTENIHPVPPGLPIIDDHVFHIFVRRYGAVDQRAEALAALASYDGMPAATLALGKNPKRLIIQLTVVRLGERLVVFDVNNRIVFRRPSGELASLGDLSTEPSIIERSAPGVVVEDVPYREHFERLSALTPSFVRMEKQRFWPRLKDEILERFIGL